MEPSEKDHGHPLDRALVATVCPAWAWIRTGAAFTRAQPPRCLPRALPPWLRPSGPPVKPKLPTQVGPSQQLTGQGPSADPAGMAVTGRSRRGRLHGDWMLGGQGGDGGGRACPSLGETGAAR